MVSPQMQIVQPGIQQFQMVPTGNSMLVNQQGAQVHIINHGNIGQNGQIVQSVSNGQQATQIQTTQISSVSSEIRQYFRRFEITVNLSRRTSV